MRVTKIFAIFLLIEANFVTQALAADITVYPVGKNDFQTIWITGPIEKGDGDAFYEIARKTPNAHVILTSPGGLVEEGLWIGAEIAIRRYYTWVLPGDGCHSICAIMWASGARRYMDKNAQISVHAAYAKVSQDGGNVEYPVSGSANAKIGAFLNEIGLSMKAIEYFTRARPEEPLKPITPEIALWLDIDAHIVDGREIARPEDRPTPRRITNQVAQYAGMANNCTEVFGVSDEFLEGQAKELLSFGHETYGGEVFTGLLGEYADVTKTEIANSGFVSWCLSAERELRLQSMDTGVNGPSFSCAKATTSTEYAICGSEDMWSLDRAMSWLYFFYRKNTNTRVSKEFLSDQRDWLRRRDECLDNSHCLIIKYQNRLAEFGI